MIRSRPCALTASPDALARALAGLTASVDAMRDEMRAMRMEVAGLKQAMGEAQSTLDTHTDQLERIEAAATEEGAGDLGEAMRAMTAAIEANGGSIDALAEVLGEALHHAA